MTKRKESLVVPRYPPAAMDWRSRVMGWSLALFAATFLLVLALALYLR